MGTILSYVGGFIFMGFILIILMGFINTMVSIIMFLWVKREKRPGVRYYFMFYLAYPVIYILSVFYEYQLLYEWVGDYKGLLLIISIISAGPIIYASYRLAGYFESRPTPPLP